MTAILVKVLADLRRRRLQTAVIFVTTLLAVITTTMTLTLISQTRDPFQAAFDAQEGAHLQVGFDSRVDPSTIAGTPSLIGATASGGPYHATDMQFQAGGNKYIVTTIARDDPNGAVERLRITAGHWPSSDSEIALTRSFAGLNHLSIGDRLKVVSVPQQPVLTVAALVVDIDQVRADVGGQPHAWVRQTAIAPLLVQDSSSYRMTYRFASDPTSEQLLADMNTLRASLPPGSITAATNYLLVHGVFKVSTQVLTSVLVAFSIFALVATAAIVGNLLTGIVISGYREIGIMKAIGFTPLQVVSVFVLQILVPTAAACVLGIPAGMLLGQPLLASSADALGLASPATYSPGIALLALVGTLLIATFAALIPALRAGLLKPAIVIANATAPRGLSGRWLRRIALLVRLPQSVVLGLGEAVSRPARAILTMVAVFVGVATIVVALGETRNFYEIYTYEAHSGTVDVVVSKSSALSDADASQLIDSQPETARVVAQTTANITVPGIGDPVYSVIFRGESSAIGYQLTAGRWFNSPGEVVAPLGLVQDAHLHVGDTFTATLRGTALKLRIVGEVYDFIAGPGGHELFMDASTTSQVTPPLSPSSYLVALRPGSQVTVFMKRLATAQPDLLDLRAEGAGQTAFLTSIAGILFGIAAVIALIALAGIFNTSLLNSRERVRDTATLRALGMSPRQIIVMVVTSSGFLAMAGGILAVPAGVGLSRLLFDLIGTLGGDGTPAKLYGIFAPWELVAIPLSGVVVAIGAALVPGRWAARTNVVEVLHAE